MNEKLFLYFSRKIGGLKVDGREYAFCHPLYLEINECGELETVCVGVDQEGDYYELRWLPIRSPDDLDDSRLVVKRIGKYEELPENAIKKIKSYLDRIG